MLHLTSSHLRRSPMLNNDENKGNDMSTTFLQQILSGRLLLVVIVGLKK